MFRDISLSLPPLPTGTYGAMAVGNFASETRPVVFVPNATGPNRLLKGGLWRDFAPPLLADAEFATHAASFADINEDGLEELYALAPPGPQRLTDRLWQRGAEGWTDLFQHSIDRHARPMGGGHAVAAYDRRGDGLYGFMVAPVNRPIRLLEWSSEWTAVDLAPALELDTNPVAHILPRPFLTSRDVLLLSITGEPTLYSPNNDNQLVNVAPSFGLGELGAVTAIEWLGDAVPSLAVARADGAHALLQTPQLHSMPYKDRASPAWALPSQTVGIAVADFDNDGVEEVIYLNGGEPSRLFRKSGSTWRLMDPGPLADPALFPTAFAIADFDGDGVLELLIARSSLAGMPAFKLYKAVRPQADWLRIAPLTRFGAPARGAIVRVGEQIRVVGTGSTEPVAHFGSPSPTPVSITWPDGTDQNLGVLQKGQTYVVDNPGG